MKRKTLLLMLLMALFSSGAWAQFTGSGSESDPYLISSSSDWSSLASKVNGGTNYSGKYFRLTSDITITSSTNSSSYMVGTMNGETNSGNYFAGIFNGDGHTITINYTTTSSSFYYTAPFRYISGATIKNVKVAGTMNVYKFMGSLVGYCMGTNNIENCVSEVAITATIGGDATMGGFISHVHGGTTNIRGCVFKGKLLKPTSGSNNPNSVGGFIGWTDSNSSGTSNFYDCVFAPSQVTVSTSNSYTFSRGNGTIKCNNSFYTQTHGTAQGSNLQYTITAGNNVSTVALGNNPVEYNLSGITGYNSTSGYGIKYNNTIYAASGNSVKLNLSSTLTNPQYSASAGSLSGTSNPYTLSMTNNNTVISATDGGSGGGGGDGTLTVYDGTATSRNVPMYVYYFDDFTRSQFVIPAADLTDMAGGTINSIKFYTKSDNIPYTTVSDFDIYVKEVNYTTINALEAKSSATIVYQGEGNFVTEGSGGSITITFSTPLTYNGGNLLIGCDNTTDTGYKSIYFYGKEVTGASTGASNGSSLDQVGFLQQNFIPKTTFFYTPASSETCEDFESVTGTSYSTAGSMPTGWYSYTTATGNNIVAPHVTSATTYNYYHSESQSVNMESGTNATASTGNYAYVVLPLYNNVTQLKYWSKRESASYGTLKLGYVDAQTSTACNNFTTLATVTPTETNTEYTIDFKNNYTLPAGKYIAFQWNTNGTYYACCIDDVCIETTGGSTPTYITEIATVADWEAFCAAVNGGYSYSGETVHLRGPVSITSQDNQQAGASGKYFQGTFEGHGNTITVNMTATGDNCAPFYGLQAATINDLIVTGSISSTYGRAAGISGTIENQDGSVGDCTFNNCISNVAITSSGGTCGGFIGHSGGYTNPTFVGCAFTGSINATAGNNYACFIGFHVSRTGWQTPYICTSHFTNCICAPSSISVNGAESATIVCGYNGGDYLLKEIENSYYNEEAVTLSTKQGTRAYTVTGASPVNVERSGDANTTYDVSGIAAYTGSTNKGLNFTQGSTTTIYAGSGETVALTLSGASTYEADHGTLAGSGSSYSLTMAASNTIISGISCAVPTNLQCTYYNRTSVTLAWTAGGDEEAWQVKYWPTNQTEPGDLDGYTTNVSTNPYTLTNLTQGQTYYVKVRAKCDENNFSDWSNTITVTPQALTYEFTNADATPNNANWDELTNWQYSDPDITVTTLPTINDNVLIKAACTIPNDCLAQANEITLYTDADTGHEYGSITIEDGGQLQHNNDGVVVTVKRYIAPYGSNHVNTNLGYKIISFPVVNGINPGSGFIEGLLTPNNPYDFYTFRYNNLENVYLEWVHVRNEDLLDPHTGYLYASQNSTTISVKGEVAPSVNQEYHLDYEEGNAAPFNGWQLVGNPFVCNAYLTAENDNLNFYEIKDYSDYAEFFPINSTVEIPPMGGVMVWLHADDNLVYSRTAPSKGPGILNMDVNKASMRGTTMLDRARVRFGEGRNLKKLQLNPRHTKLYIPEDGNDFSVYYAEGAGTIPVNFKAQDNGSYTLSFSTEDVGFNYLHLIDNMNGNDVDLLQTPYYTFDAKSTDFASRFTLVFATGNDNDGNFAFFNNGVWIINNDGDATLQVVDVLGHILSSETISGSCSKAINVAPGVYMLRLVNGDKVKVQKIVVR